MNKTAKQLALVLSAALALGMGASSAFAQDVGYVKAPVSENVTVKNPFGLCWRTGYWTPAMATLECDPDLVPKAAPAPAPAPRVAPPAPAPAAPAAKPAPAPVKEKVTMAADAHFDFDKSVA